MGKFKLTAKESLMLVVDFQEKLMPAIDRREKIIHNAGLLLRLAGLLSIPVILTEQYPQGLGVTVPEIKDVLPEYAPVEKRLFSAFIPEVEQKLKELNRSQIIVTGTETHVCVFQTVRDLVAARYEVYLVRDAVGSRFKENYQSGLELMRDLGAIITNTETVIFDLLQVAEGPAFKEMSKLLK
ncbi:isochorismatase family protein [Syntrophothermus lipocalidus]|uniref:Isochorismatase hydrolase n=1 Tax=Syntrophothermus lipocalidus (strain DSM 12680 / TGB-C1) TaxID=643648 RepID=D7CIT1_SYNLT|nr:isochorismatase family protein [Syntrophothermus lipocalidus]ADI02809.1 isochorismatase hydrolase [Syntrophothermus lipocalidus DSM 12680]